MCPSGSTLRAETTTVGSDLRPAFNVVDVDQDGKISRDDLRKFYPGFSSGGAENRAAFPKNFKVKNPWRYLSYVIRDVFVVFALAAAAAYFTSWSFWPLYWAAQGTMFWAIFVLGHDCGHGIISDNLILNSLMWHIFHSSVLVACHGWRISHITHHPNDGSVENDKSWVQVLFMICTLTLWLLLDIVETRPIVPLRKDTHAVNPWVSTESSYRSHFKDYEVLHRLKASAEQHLRVFALEIVEGSDGGEEDVSLQLEYQRSQETSISRCQEENMLHFRGNRGGSDRDEGEGEEEEGRNGGRGNGSGRRHGGGGGGGGGGGDGGGGGGGEGGDGEEGDVEGGGGDKKELRPTLKMLQPIAMSTIANTAQTLGSVISLKVGGLTFFTKILLILVMAISLAGYLCSIIAILLMHERPRFSRVLVWIGCAASTSGFLILIVAFILEL